MDLQLTGDVAVVVGGARGIGGAIVEALAAEGAKLVIVDREPTPDKVCAFAELNYIAGKKAELTDPAAALDYFGTAVTHAYQYLFDERYRSQRNPYDPEFRGACDLYNGALESALRIVKKDGGLKPGMTHLIKAASHTMNMKIA